MVASASFTNTASFVLWKGFLGVEYEVPGPFFEPALLGSHRQACADPLLRSVVLPLVIINACCILKTYLHCLRDLNKE